MQRMIASGLTMQRIMDMSQDDVEKMIYGMFVASGVWFCGKKADGMAEFGK